jgi:sugar O-acyltransferase (sialic acid O-acetyltransferase NeuD family)
VLAKDWANLVIVGAGGYGHEVLSYAQDASGLGADLRIKGFLDDNPAAVGQAATAPWIGTIGGYEVTSSDRFVIAIGDPLTRAGATANLTRRGAEFTNIIHPQAVVARSARIGQGCVIGPFCAVGNAAFLADHVILTWYCAVAHDAFVDSWCTVGPHAAINGGVALDRGVFVGSHASLNPAVDVGAWTRVAAGSVVYGSVAPGSFVSGNPAVTAPMGYHEKVPAFVADAEYESVIILR